MTDAERKVISEAVKILIDEYKKCLGKYEEPELWALYNTYTKLKERKDGQT